ncbi:tyramine receptor Ser-2-like [Acanthaster planci]|uniref:Tyramine receptor Ser-2-like n=1 Tax=Acanthaster planci TaxID=133434 RepID=A0A8B7YJD1_ACAPL|nr:tyramine receptor Ser-2-like [Acanthaster planci]XP_022092515.1 tyramine receptor Ser-2-like [Acanthaster planci]
MGNDTVLSTIAPVHLNLTTTPIQHLPSTTKMYIPDEFDLSPATERIFVPVIVITLFVGLLANALAVFITAKCAKENKEHKLTIPGILVRALLATDTSATVFFFIRGCCLTLYRDTWIQCNLDLASNLFFSWASGLVNLLMSCDRCLALGAPFFYHVHVTRSKTYLTLTLSLLLAGVLSLLPVFGFGAYNIYIQGEYHCLAPGDLQFKATAFDFSFNVIFFTLGLGILVITYIANSVVLRQLLKLRRHFVTVLDSEMSRVQHSTEGEVHLKDGTSGVGTKAFSRSVTKNSNTIPQSNANERTGGYDYMPKNSISTIDLRDEGGPSRPMSTSRERTSMPKQPDTGKTEMRFGVMILVFSMVFTLSWLPFYIQRLVKAVTGSSSQLALVIVIYLLTLNHVIDPFVYVLMKRQYRKKLEQLGRRWRSLLCQRCRGDEAPSSTPVMRSISSTFYGNRQNSLGTTITSCTVTAGYGTAPRKGLHLPTIQVTAASPSLASEVSHMASSTEAVLDEAGSLYSGCADIP